MSLYVNKCFICGAMVEDGSSLCSWQCEARAEEQKRWAGREPCTACEEQGDMEPATVGELCAFHDAKETEAAYERLLEDFYGGSSPVTVAEQMRDAQKVK